MMFLTKPLDLPENQAGHWLARWMTIMKNKITFSIFTPLAILTFPAVALATAGLGELDDTAAFFFLVSIFLGMCLIPFGLKGSWAFAWYFPWLQISLILILVALAARTLQARKCRTLTYVFILPTLYAVLTFTTNLAATIFFRSDPFPKGRAINSLLNTVDENEKPTEADIIQNLGKPFAEGFFPATSPALPKGMDELMKSCNLESAFILTYVEKDRGPRGVETQTYYIFLEPATRRYVTKSGFLDPAVAADKWPHKGL